MLKDQICNLTANVQQEEIRVTVRRNHLWSDFSRARSDYYSPLNTIKITFSGEPAIDDGGPKREFFSGGQVQFLGIDLGLIFILLFVSSVIKRAGFLEDDNIIMMLAPTALTSNPHHHFIERLQVLHVLEFFNFIEMIEYCSNRLFPDGFPTKSMLAVTRDDFVTAGEVMAMSVVQGGPSPNFLARGIYNVVSRSFAIEELKDESLKETCVKVQMIYLKFQAI